MRLIGMNPLDCGRAFDVDTKGKRVLFTSASLFIELSYPNRICKNIT